MPWPQQRRLLGTKIPRLDGPEKATGRARYTFDINRRGMLHAKILRCPHAHVRVRNIDTSAAQKTPGFRALVMVARPETRNWAAGVGIAALAPASELFYAGEEVLAVACDTEEHCDDALRAIRVDYELLPFQVKEEDGLRLRAQAGTAAPNLTSNVLQPNITNSDGWGANAFNGLTVHEGTYGVPVICHQCLESHGIVCEWDDQLQNLTVWASSQGVTNSANSLAQRLRIPVTRVKCITHFMGGGFGSKFGGEVEDLICAQLARSARAPVKLMLDRAEEVTNGGTRPSAFGRVKIGANSQGEIRAYEVECHGTPGTASSSTVNIGLLPYVYVTVPNFRRKVEIVRLNTQKVRAMRAPGHPQNCVLTDQPFDDLAARLNMDPLQMRLRNIPPNDQNAMRNLPTSWLALRNTIHTRQIEIARRLSDWDARWHPPGRGDGPIKTGMGMAMHLWQGGGNPGNQVTVTISNDGSVLVESSTQDLGTANRTMMAIVVAEILGLEVRDITVRIGESPFGASTPSGGSTTCPSVAPAALNAAEAARTELFAALAPRLEAQPSDLAIEPGQIVNRTNNTRTPWRQACARLGTQQISAQRSGGQVPAGQPPIVNGAGGVGGVQIAEVKVDTETGVVRCTKFIAVQDCGLIINKLACESQVAGGVIMGINYALFEERIMDSRTGRQCNPDMEFYKLGGIQDMPQIIVHMMDMPERGVIGIGEPPTVSTCAAVGNAVFNAIGRRVPYAPFTPQRVLEALAAQ
jgi:xanthine dehydrogenase YagR molybdenum-binding subunit